MATYEDSYKSLLQGVSQQIPRERLDGQVAAQENMLSDTVTNVRRRLGAQFAFTLTIPNATSDSIVAWDTDLAGAKVQLILNIVDGVIRILDLSYNVLATLPACAYLVATDIQYIQAATVGDEFFLCNTQNKAILGASTTDADPSKRGFAYVRTSNFSKSYDVKLQTALGSGTYTYTTPNGSTAGDAALATPEYIATQIKTAVNAATGTHGVTCTSEAGFLYFDCAGVTTSLAVNTSSGSLFMTSSGQAYVRQDVDLPTRLPALANGFVCATGEVKSPRYYKYDSTKILWLECGDYQSSLSITNVPVSVTNTLGTWALVTTPFEGRLAGDDTSNPVPDFVTRGITGMASYQGRLVLLAGPMVNLSGSAKPRRFYRSTVTALLDNDCISVGASAASSAAYQYAVPFQKDLLLFSSKYQALIPGSNVAITPKTAAVLPTSAYEADMTSKPIAVGRTLMYAAPRSKDFFGLMEMVPNSALDAQYTSLDSTPHLPKYMAGRMRFAVSSSVANMVLFAPTNDRKALIVHEYTWSGDNKVQQAWHRWSFQYNIAAAYFSGQVIHLLFVNNGTLIACTVDPRSGTTTSTGDRKPYLDLGVFTDVVDNVVQVPAWMIAFDPAIRSKVKVAVASGRMAGNAVGVTLNGSVLSTVLSFPNGRVSLGLNFKSTLAPSQPLIKDSQGVQISTNKMTLLRYMLSTNNSGSYDVTISDKYGEADEVYNQSTLLFSSTELVLGNALVGADSTAIVPARMNAASSSFIISTDGTEELNLVGLEYVAHSAQKINRKQHGSR